MATGAGVRTAEAGRTVGSLPGTLARWARRTFPAGRSLPGEQWERHHAFVLRVLAVLSVAVPLYAAMRGYGAAHVFGHAAPLLLLLAVARLAALPRSYRAVTAAVGLMTASALVVHSSNGQTEAHFMFFALLPLAALYAARTPFLAAVGYVAVHHFALGSVAPGSVFESNEPALGVVTVHATFVLVESWACLIAWRLFEDRRELVEHLVLQRTAQAREQRDAMAHLAAVVQSTDDAVMTTTTEGVVLTWNPGAERLYGYDAGEIVGRHISTVFPSGRPETLQATRAALAHTPSLLVERLHVRKDGTSFEALVTISTIYDDAGRTTGIAAIARDISRQKRSEEETLATARQLQEQADELTRLALHDPLTGLANRALMHDRLEHALSTRRETRNAVLLLDLDDFKSINDVFGHGVGDAVLIEVARRLESCVRPSDTVARLGGDEFVILMEDIEGCEDAVTVADRLLVSLGEPIHLARERFLVGGSVGITVTDRAEDRGTSELLRDADIAMYAAKTGGKDRYKLFEPGMHDEVVARTELLRDLRHAVTGEQLRLLYQPQVHLPTGRTTGVEALVRWERSEGELVMPGTFIPVAESAGLINAIDDWVLEEACTQLRAWDDAGLDPVRVAVNISASRLTTGDLAGTIAALTLTTGLDPTRLEIEITETVAAGHMAEAAETVTNVRALGVRVAIDDFGMGHSSLSRLQTFPLDRLKIDRSFVAPLDVHTTHGSIADAMFALGKSLGLEVVAEGVETEEHLQALRALGCVIAQGYLLGRPAPAAEIERLLRAGDPLERLTTC